MITDIKNADNRGNKEHMNTYGLYGDLTYKIIGALYEVHSIPLPLDGGGSGWG